MTVPGLWLYGELDRSQPTRESVAILDRLIQDHNKDFTYRVFEGADHGIAIDGVLADGVSETMKEWLLAHVTLNQAGLPGGPRDQRIENSTGFETVPGALAGIDPTATYRPDAAIVPSLQT